MESRWQSWSTRRDEVEAPLSSCMERGDPSLSPSLCRDSVLGAGNHGFKALSVLGGSPCVEEQGGLPGSCRASRLFAGPGHGPSSLWPCLAGGCPLEV